MDEAKDASGNRGEGQGGIAEGGTLGIDATVGTVGAGGGRTGLGTTIGRTIGDSSIDALGTGSIAGIPGFLRRALNDFINYSKEVTTASVAIGKPDIEACGLFLFVAEDWTPEFGWSGKIEFAPVKNVSKRGSGFEMDNEDAQAKMYSALEARMRVARGVCERHGWTRETPWTVPVHERAIDRDQEISELRDAFARAVGNGADDLSAKEWLMVRGTAVLAGIGHSHPSGNADISPDDYFYTTIVEAWQKIFQYRYDLLGQKKDSTLENISSVGNWTYGLPERVEFFNPAILPSSSLNPGTWRDAKRKLGDVNTFRFAGHSHLVRYDKRGKRGEWRGPF